MRCLKNIPYLFSSLYDSMTHLQELEGAKLENRQAIREKLYSYSHGCEMADYDTKCQMDSIRERIEEVMVKVKYTGQGHDFFYISYFICEV